MLVLFMNQLALETADLLALLLDYDKQSTLVLLAQDYGFLSRIHDSIFDQSHEFLAIIANLRLK